eukprot:7049155-Pyramimonas_sp.AAC.1
MATDVESDYKIVGFPPPLDILRVKVRVVAGMIRTETWRFKEYFFKLSWRVDGAFKALLDALNVDLLGAQDGKSPFAMASERGRADIVEILLSESQQARYIHRRNAETHQKCPRKSLNRVTRNRLAES